jgi:signal peptidase I
MSDDEQDLLDESQRAPEGQPAEPDGRLPEPVLVTQDESGDEPESPEGDDAGAETTAARRKTSFWVELPVLLVIALVIAVVIKTFVIQMFFIPTGSMQNTLAINDRIVVNKLVYHFRPIEPGDIVVFNGDGSWDPQPPAAKPSSDPVVRLWDDSVARLYRAVTSMFHGSSSDDILVKRVIGVPGDHVVCCNAKGQLTVNGVALDEKPYLYPGNTSGSAPAPTYGQFNIVVPAGRMWVLGDHRAISDDSRLHAGDPGGGTVPESAVIGRAFVIVWPPSHWRFLPIPSTFDQPGVDHGKPAQGKAAALAADTVPYLPVGGGFALALPLTLLERRLRRRLRPGRRRRGTAGPGVTTPGGGEG